jgi:hypothetical protein
MRRLTEELIHQAASELARRANRAAFLAMTPEARHLRAIKANAVRWSRYRAKQREEKRESGKKEQA